MTGPEAHKLAAHKARYGHRCWIAWKERDGTYSVALQTPETVKRAMLAVGTQGRWQSYSGTIGYVQRWWMGWTYIRNERAFARG